MAEFWILDSKLQKVTLLQDVFSVMWMPRYSEVGTAEIHARPTAENLEMLQIGTMILNLERKEICFIKYRFIDESGEYPEITIRGVLENIGNWINIQTIKLEKLSNLHYLVNHNLRDEKYIGFESAVDGPDLALIPFETTWENLADTVTEVCSTYGAGFRMTYRKTSRSTYILFKVYVKGKNDLVRFSDDLGNLIIQSYEQSVEDSYNVAYVAGEGEGSERVVEIVDLSNGGIRRELYVDARDLQSTTEGEDGEEITISPAEYKRQLRERGLEALAESGPLNVFTTEPNTRDTLFRLGIDYDIGDVIPCQSVVFNVEKDFRIEGLNIIYEKNELIELVLKEESEAKQTWQKEHSH